jgi:DNA polymerase-3 subunit alpha
MQPKREFVHLHTHSHFSILEALGKTSSLIEQAKSLGMQAMAITDLDNLYGAIEFYTKAQKAHFKPIIGVDLGISLDQKTIFRLPLLAKTYTGYINLIKLTTKAHLEKINDHPAVPLSELHKYSEGIICLTGDYRGHLGTLLLQRNAEEAITFLQQLKTIFTETYIELIPHQSSKQGQLNTLLLQLAEQTKTPSVTTNNVFYIHPEDALPHDILLAIKQKTTLQNPDRQSLMESDYSLKSPENMWEIALANGFPIESLTNTVLIAESINYEIPLYQIQLPRFDVPKSTTGEPQQDFEYLEQLARQGVFARYPQNPPDELEERLCYELEVIKNSGYSSYFLIVQDFINWAKQNNILVGPGRGSAAGSLVSYLIGITDLDPLKFDLLFERFLNPDRVSMPDIDIDFQDNKRDLVLDYVAEKYGRDHVAQICTFGTMAAKASVRDTGRALGMSYSFCDSIAKLIAEKSIRESIESNRELKSRYEEEEQVKKLLDHSMSLEGSVRHTSTHACAVVITKDQLTEYTPLQISESGSKSTITTQYEMHAIEDLGLLKMDFLGLANLSIIQDAINLIKLHHNIVITLSEIPLDDASAYRLFQKGQTVGVFQFESQGMKNALIGLKPTHFDDLIAMVSLYRPGPMELIPTYIARKHGKEKVTYLHPSLEAVLGSTYGIMIYQEQLMKASQVISGFSLPEADILRKAVGKKIIELLEEQKTKIIEGAVRNGIEREIGEKLWQLIEPFARYGFNKSHAACYALVAYHTAYLKAHYPVEFLVSLMNSDSKDLPRLEVEITEAKQMGITVHPPSINHSFAQFTGNNKDIQYGLSSIRNMSEKLAQIIAQERESRGIFLSIENFLDRIPSKELNKKNLEALIKSGALDEFEDRLILLHNLENILHYCKLTQNTPTQTSQSLLFGISVQKPTLQLEYPQDDLTNAFLTKISLEKEFLGIALSAHPIDMYQTRITELKLPNIHEVKSSKRNTGHKLAGIVSSIREIRTKKGEKMAFVELIDTSDKIELILFPRTYQATGNYLQEQACMITKGKLDKKNGVKLIVDDIRSIETPEIEKWLTQANSHTFIKNTVELLGVENLHKKNGENLNIVGLNIPLPSKLTKPQLEELRTYLATIPKGPCRVHLIKNPHSYAAESLDTTLSITYNPEIIDQVKAILYAEKNN